MSQANRSNKNICRDFLWGKCNKFLNCKKRHELDIDEMRKVIKFCHNYQNRAGCSGCSYIHGTKEEQILFNNEGQLPRQLAERHESMAAASIQVFLAPPPPPPVMAPPPPPPPPVFHPPLQAPPPPPPPPQNGHTQTHYPAARQPATYSGAATDMRLPRTSTPMSNLYGMPVGFDPSRPPPLKRKDRSAGDAGPSKVSRVDGGCAECKRREKRLCGYMKEIDEKMKSEADQDFLVKKRRDEISTKKKIFLSWVPHDQRRVLDELIEGDRTPQQVPAAAPANNEEDSEMATIPKNVLLRFMECILSTREEANNRNEQVSGSLSQMMRLLEQSQAQALQQPQVQPPAQPQAQPPQPPQPQYFPQFFPQFFAQAGPSNPCPPPQQPPPRPTQPLYPTMPPPSQHYQ